MRYYELTREARTEFGKLMVGSLLRSVELEAASARGHRLRRIERRMRELRAALAVLSPEGSPVGRRGRVSLFRAVTAVWLVAVSVTVAYVAAFGINNGTAVVDVAMLVTTAVWMAIWITATPEAEREDATAAGGGDEHTRGDCPTSGESAAVDRIKSWLA